MTEIVVPYPEPEWKEALHLPHPDDGGNQNPAWQYFTFEEAMGRYRDIAALTLNITDIARRLRLMLEPGCADQLGAVDAAFFSIRRVSFAVYRYATQEVTLLGLFRQDGIGVVEAIDVLLETLGLDWRAVASANVGDAHNQLFLEPILDADLRPSFPNLSDDAEQIASGS